MTSACLYGRKPDGSVPPVSSGLTCWEHIRRTQSVRFRSSDDVASDGEPDQATANSKELRNPSKMLMTTEQTAHPLFHIGNRLFGSRFDGRQRLCLLLLLMLLDEQFLNLVLPVVEGGEVLS